jgi:RNA polymerase sigma-70 factor (ECF subfamily)
MTRVHSGTHPVSTRRDQEFRALYETEYAKLAGYCWQLQRDRDAAAETAQEAFTRLFGRWVSVQQPRAYLYRTATNIIRDGWSARLRRQETLDALREEREPAAPDLAAAVAVRSAVEALPQRLRPVVLLHYYADLNVADVAAATRRPAGTVKRQLSEARALLAGDLQESTHG